MYFQPNSTGEQKTKPTQNSVRELRGLGLSPDLVSLYSLYVIKSQSMSSHSSSEIFFVVVADCLSLLNSIGHCCQRENLHVLPCGTWTGDLCTWRVLHLQSTFTPGGSGHRWLPLPQAGLSHCDETSKNAHKVEGDVRQVCIRLTVPSDNSKVVAAVLSDLCFCSLGLTDSWSKPPLL